VVVDAQYRLTFEGAHQVCHGLVVLEGEWYAVALGLLVWRVEVKEGEGAIIFNDAALPVQVFDEGSG